MQSVVAGQRDGDSDLPSCVSSRSPLEKFLMNLTVWRTLSLTSQVVIFAEVVSGITVIAVFHPIIECGSRPMIRFG